MDYKNNHIKDYLPVFFRLTDGNEEQKKKNLLEKINRFDNTAQDDFKKSPACPLPIGYLIQLAILFMKILQSGTQYQSGGHDNR